MIIKTIIQARLGSTRFKGKILKEVLGKPLLQHMIERLQHSQYASDIIIATTIEKRDNPIENLSSSLKIPCFAGSENDVLDRYYKAAKKYETDVVVRLTSDCPLIDPEITDRVIQFYLDNKEKYDFVSNMHPPTFPDGLDTEVIPFYALEKSWNEAHKIYEREHVSPYIWDNPHIFRLGNVFNNQELHLKQRWTIDYEEDFQFIKAIYENLYQEGEIFYMKDILKLLSEKKEIHNLNKKYLGDNWWKKHWSELKTTHNLRTRGKK